MNHRVLIVTDNLPRAAFFSRFVPELVRRHAAVKFLPYRLSTHRYLVSRGFDSTLLMPASAPTSMDVHQACAKSLEVISGDASLKRVEAIASRLAASIGHAMDDFRPSHLFLWNGSQLVERLAKRMCPPEVETQFFEIANIPGKLFVDPEGVNAASSLYRAPEQLSNAVVNDSEFDEWRCEYLQAQRTRGVPQAKAALALQWERPLDAIASRFGKGFYPITMSRMLARLKGKLSQSQLVGDLAAKFARPSDHANPYRFFPLQVSGDTQLLLNSDVGNLQALDQVIAECRGDHVDLVIKVHPAENNSQALKRLASKLTDARRDLRCFVSTQPTPLLIEGADRVYTINSTVGLETLILGKPLTVFGRAFFQHFDQNPQWLQTYVLRYLTDFDYFGDAPADANFVDRCLNGWCHA